MADAALAGTLDAIIDKFRALRTSSESSQEFWKEQALALLDQLESLSLAAHKPTFDFGGDDDSDETSSEPAEVSVPVPVPTKPEPVDGEVRPTLERTIEELERDMKKDIKLLPGDYLRLLNRDKIKARLLEKEYLGYNETSVAVRRAFVAQQRPLTNLPYKDYDYGMLEDACCECPIGYVPVPTGVVGPTKINGGPPVFVPMSTVEGALIASVNRGWSAMMRSGGVRAQVFAEGMTRAPVAQFEDPADVVRLQKWVRVPENFDNIKREFELKSSYTKLDDIEVLLDEECEDLVHLRFTAKTGDAMGMNMISKAASQAMKFIQLSFPTMKVWLSGNACSDKKAAAINWEKGRGRSVRAECVLPPSVVTKIFGTTPAAMAECARAKFKSGSRVARAIGGANAQAANIVAAIFIATGQDAAQVISSSMCETRLEEMADGSLHASVLMKCVECGTVGGGTILPAQKACLQLLGVAGPSPAACAPGTNANSLAEIIASTVLAGELSLMAALCTDDLVKSHLRLNRSKQNLYGIEAGASSQPTINLQPPQQLHPIRGKSVDRTMLKVNCSSIL